MAFPVLAALAGAVANFGSTAYQHQNNLDLQNHSYDYGQSADRNHIPNTVAGLKAAGLSPALASGSFGSPASGPSVPSSSAPQMPNFIEAAQLEQNQQLIDAQAGLIEAQTEQQDIMNTRLRDEDYTLDSSIRGQLEAWANDDSKPERQLAAQLMLDSNQLYTRGTADGLRAWNLVANEADKSLTDAVVNQFTRLVYQQKGKNGTIDALAEMDKAELAKLVNESILLMREASKASTEADVNVARLDEISAHIRNMIEDSDLTYSKNFQKMFKNKDKLGVFSSLFFQAVQSAAAGAGFAVGAKGASKAVGAGSVLKKSVSESSGSPVFNGSGFGPKVSKPQKPFDSLPMSVKNRRLLNSY